MLAGRDAADLVLHLELVGRTHRDGVEGLGHGDSLLGAQDGAAGGQAVHGAPRHVQAAERRDGGVRVHRERHPEVEGGARRVHPGGPVRSDRLAGVLVAPEPGVVGEDVGAHAEAGHAPVLAGAGELAVLDGVAVVEPGMLGEQVLDGLEVHVDGLVAVAVHVDQQARPVVGAQDVGDLLGRHDPDAVALLEVAGPAQPGREALD